ncbi:MAG: Xylulose kinase [candidate division TA06 bacterium ADurb.Bin417]|uniref:Xylulose kinase n=1 Tax=candidate division TA06 bacterium ADurb.Bin417 TaxID=1852828 RepID=A0A1V5MJ77_UNCT6|nr:MAG: Xylulose kinase [candidate division TA06 bacterium ADurb.Bin417]
MAADLFLGIDVGTSGVKVLLVDSNGRVVDQQDESYPLLEPRPLWAEQDPEAWWRATARALKKVSERQPLNKRLAAVGLAGQMHGSVFLDGRDRMVRPALLWCDQRTGAEAAEIETAVGPEKLRRITGNPLFTGFTAPKVRWLQKHEPDNYRRTARLFLPKDYIRYRLTGIAASEVTDNSGTGFFDIRKRNWSAEITAAAGVPDRWLPPVLESPAIAGKVSPTAAGRTGLPAGCPVAAGAGDQAASGVGNGVVRPGVVSATLGTSGVVFAYSDRLRRDPAGRIHTMCHAVPGAWHLMGVTLAAGGALRWYRDTFCPAEKAEAQRKQTDPYEIMTAAAGRVPAGAGGLIFLPYLNGERTPHANPLARAVFFGATSRHTRDYFTRAVLEGVTFALRDSLEMMKGLKLPVREVRLSGGGARSRLWCQMQADNFQVVCRRTVNPDTTALGAAILAACGSGTFASVADGCAGMVRTGRVFQPDPAVEKRYKKAYLLFDSLYPALADSFDRAAEIEL